MFPARAKRVIFLFMHGGPSSIDTFDPKPYLDANDGKPLPIKQPLTFAAGKTGGLMKSPWKFKNCGQSGLPISDLFPDIRECADDLCVVRSMVGEGVDHGAALLQTFTGTFTFTRPSMGSWVLYGLGTREPQSARLHHDQAGAFAWRREELELRLSARLGAGHGDRPRRHAGGRDPEGADRISDQPGPHARTAAV